MGFQQTTLAITTAVCVCFILAAGCRPLRINDVRDRIHPSNARPWTPELTVLPSADLQGDQIRIHNIRNINYISDKDFVVKHFDRTIDLSEIQSVDFVVTPFSNIPILAHTMLSFGLADGTYLGVSVEVRNETGEEYSPLLGISRQFEITYVIADERDLIRVRTRHRNAEVYVYPSVATPEQSRQLFVNVLQRVNKLNVEPEFYNSLRNNCTTNLVQHVNELNPDRIAWGWRILLPGFSARYAYDLGLLDNRIPFEDLTALAYVNDLAAEYYEDPDFSQLIRSKRKRIPRLIARQQARASTLTAPGQQYIESNLPERPRLWR